MLRICSSSHRSLAVAAMLVLVCTSTQGGKPKPPPPPPPPPAVGTIFYTDPGGFWAMNADGSQKTQIVLGLPLDHPDILGTPTAPPWGIPCDRVYGSDPRHDRWYLCLAPTGRYDRIIIPDGREIANPDRYYHHDIFAYRTNPANRNELQVVQVTDYFGEAWTEMYAAAAGWSNDSNESPSTSYIDSATWELGDCFVVEEDEVGDPLFVIDFRIDPSKWHPQTYDTIHVPLTAGEVQMAWDLEVDLDLSLSGDTEIRPFYTPPSSVSPAGTEFVSAENDQIVVRRMSDGALVRTVWDGTQGVEPTKPVDPIWSRDGTTIVFENGYGNYLSTGGVWTTPAAGGGTPVQLAKNSYKGWVWTKYTNPQCAPDSSDVCIRFWREDARRLPRTYYGDLLLFPFAGGSSTNVTDDIPDFVNNCYRWASNTPAP